MSLRSNLAAQLSFVTLLTVGLVNSVPPATSAEPASALAPGAMAKSPRPPAPFGPPPALAVMMAMDLDHDGGLSSNEILQASASLADLDKNQDGDVGAEELKEEVSRRFPSPPMGRFGFSGLRRSGSGPGANGSFGFRLPERSASQKQFVSFDANQDGKIIADELPAELVWLIDKFDANRSGAMESSEISDLETALFEGSDAAELQKQVYSGQALNAEVIHQLTMKSREFLQRKTQNENEVSSQRQRSQMAYYVNVCVMFLSVIAFGHLLASHPPRLRGWREMNADSDAMSAVGYSVMFTIALAALDLAWTLTSSQNDHFRELNPMGNLILASSSLPLFRLLTIGLSASLFIALRRYRGAQVGSWWMCLVYVLVTWRWFLAKSLLTD